MPWVPRQVEKFRNHSAIPTTSPSVLGDVAEQGGGVAEQDAGQLLLGQPRLVQRLLVVGELADEADDGRDVVRADGPDRHERASLSRVGQQPGQRRDDRAAAAGPAGSRRRARRR